MISQKIVVSKKVLKKDFNLADLIKTEAIQFQEEGFCCVKDEEETVPKEIKNDEEMPKIEELEIRIPEILKETLDIDACKKPEVEIVKIHKKSFWKYYCC